MKDNLEDEMNKWIAVAVALIGCGTSAVDAPGGAIETRGVDQVSISDTDVPMEPVILAQSESDTESEPDVAPYGDPGDETLAAAETLDAEPSLDEAPAVPMHTFELRRGESLHHFARWSELPIEQIAAQSELALDGEYAVGTQVRLQLTAEDLARVEARRDAHHQTRATAYLDSRGPHSTGFYTVKTGDSAWKIAQRSEAIPVWLIESMNPSVDLERLRPGEELLVPIFVDVTASLDDED